MKLCQIKIRNFRGIRELDWNVPDKHLLCLIGRGDSSKSTILEAIRRAFYPQWNLLFDDADFYNCDPQNAIEIYILLTDIIDDFKDLASYGAHLCGWNAEALERHDEPGEGLNEALLIKLTVSGELEPKWTVIKQENDDGIPFKQNDRAKVSANYIGVYSDRHLTWSKGSILSQLTESQNLTSSLAEAGRAAKDSLDARRAQNLTNFDAAATKAQATAEELGVAVSESYKAHLDSDAINIKKGGLTLHDGNIPLRQLGLGSKRMLTTGLQKKALEPSHITLLDEVEVGLEPHRIARLLQHLNEDTSGQYFITTHSPVVLRELTINDLFILHNNEGSAEIVNADIDEVIQGKIRSCADAFLAPKIIICEGATEIGFLRGLDIHYWIPKELNSLAYNGVSLFDAHGASKIRNTSESIKKLKYDIAVFADSDEREQFSIADETALRENGITVVTWQGDFSIEERIVNDITWAGATATINLAAEYRDLDKVIDQIQSQYEGDDFDRDIENWNDNERLRQAIGKAAKRSEWFKRIDKAQEWARVLSPHLDNPDIEQSDLITKLSALRQWIDNAGA